MTLEILAIIVTTSLAAIARWLMALLRPASALGLTIFRPYRGDPWPRGVQEDLEIHFDWSPKTPRTPIQPTWTDIVVEPDANATIAVMDDDAAVEIEELSGDSAAIEHVHGDGVHIAPR
jgi:hypothetical protein